MLKLKNSFTFIFAMLIATSAFASKEYPFRVGVVRYRLGLAPVTCFYKKYRDPNITNLKANAGFCATLKAEIFSGGRTNLLFGVEYLSQAFTFEGYYAAPGYTYVYDGTFPYSHYSRVQEIDAPIGIKTSFISEEENYFSPYFSGGFAPRYIVTSYSLIVNDSSGITMLDGKGKIDFENNIGVLPGIPMVRKLNGFVYGGVGVQYNFRGSAKAIFFEITYKYGLSRFNYHGFNNSNSVFVKNSNMGFVLGVRF
jgi:hypothetical protein